MSFLRFNKIEDSIGLLEWDQKDSSVNLISIRFMEELEQVLNRLERDPPKALVLISRKLNHFCAGADIKEIEKIPSAKELKKLLDKAHSLLFRFENLKTSKIAVISGPCLGGGLEWALAFDYRLLANSSHVQLAFPELRLGLIPGFGACLRLPRQIGLRASMDMILKSRALKAKSALAKGLADELAPPFALEQRAFELARQIVKGEKPERPLTSYRHKNPWGFFLESALFRPLIFFAKRQALKKTKGLYPAPLEFLKLLKKTGCKSNPLSLKNKEQEAKAFCKLFESPESRNLIYLWRQAQKAKKGPAQKDSLRAPPKGLKKIERIGVVGAGAMGQAIAFLLADKGFFVRLIDSKPQRLCEALGFAQTQWKNQTQKGQMTSYEWRQKQNSLSLGQGFDGFSALDLVIEALPEDFSIKSRLVKEISSRMRPLALLASNTSSLSIKEMARLSAFPKNFFGLHFFHPAERLPLVELILPPLGASAFPIDSVREFLNKIGKIPIAVSDSPGFLVNRLLAGFLSSALLLFEKGVGIYKIDSVYRDQLGLALGPFELMDKIGLDICAVVLAHLRQRGLKFSAPEWARSLPDILGQGEKSGQGFYMYDDKKSPYNVYLRRFFSYGENPAFIKRKKPLNDKVKSLKRLSSSCSLTDSELLNFGLSRMIKEAELLLKKGLVKSAEDIDLALVMGAGFPAVSGGLMTYAKALNFK